MRRIARRTITSAALTAALLGFALGTEARGQDALGSGNALDASLDPRTGGVNPSAPQENFRARNELITGNVIGGRGFRGSVGYSAAGDFLGATGSNDFFQFRADSAYSSIDFINLGSTYQQLRFGQDLGLIEYDRPTRGTRMSDILDRSSPRQSLRYGPTQIIDRQLVLNQANLDSSLYEETSRSAEPNTIGILRSEEGGVRTLNVSPLRGVTATPIEQEGRMRGLSTYDMARIRQDAAQDANYSQGIGAAFDDSYMGLVQPEAGESTTDEPRPPQRSGAESTRIPTGPQSTRVTGEQPQNRIGFRPINEYDQIRERIAERYAALDEGVTQTTSRNDVLASLDQRMRDLRNQLAGTTDPESAVATTPPGGLPDLPATGEDQPPINRRGEEGDRRRPANRGENAPSPADREGELQLEKILRHGERIERLTSEDRTRFNELMAAGEESLRAGEYFWAERRFNRALRFTPGHPLATAGLAHAQIGAGLYLSSGLTLHSLFVHQPEMIDARYDEGLIPNRPILLESVRALRDRIQRRSADRGMNGFLLAYIGRLLDDRAMVDEGLTVMREGLPEDRILPLLEKIWLAQEPAEK